MKQKTVYVRRIATAQTFTLCATRGAEITYIHARARAWINARARAQNPVRGAKLVPYGLEFDRSLWSVKDVKCIMTRLGFQPA
jgi:hypothetical protein